MPLPSISDLPDLNTSHTENKLACQEYPSGSVSSSDHLDPFRLATHADCHNCQSLAHICVVEVSDIKWKRPGLKLNAFGRVHSMSALKRPGDCSACGDHRLFASMDDWQEDSKA